MNILNFGENAAMLDYDRKFRDINWVIVEPKLDRFSSNYFQKIVRRLDNWNMMVWTFMKYDHRA